MGGRGWPSARPLTNYLATPKSKSKGKSFRDTKAHSVLLQCPSPIVGKTELLAKFDRFFSHFGELFGGVLFVGVKANQLHDIGSLRPVLGLRFVLPAFPHHLFGKRHGLLLLVVPVILFCQHSSVFFPLFPDA